MATAQGSNPDIIDTVLGALDTVAKRVCHHGFYIDRKDKKKFLGLLRKKNVEEKSRWDIPHLNDEVNNDVPYSFQPPGQRIAQGRAGVRAAGGGELGGRLNPRLRLGQFRGELNADFLAESNEIWREDPLIVQPRVRMQRQGSHTHISHSVQLIVQANYPIRVYASKPVKIGAALGGGVGGVVGGLTGASGGVAAGALIGSIVPVAGTIFGGIIGGIVGGIGGAVAGGAAGAGVGAGGGAITGNIKHHIVYARDVFRELPEFSEDKNSNVVQCTIPMTTVCTANLCTRTPADGKLQNDRKKSDCK